jgi:hypothetical protein
MSSNTTAIGKESRRSDRLKSVSTGCNDAFFDSVSGPLLYALEMEVRE